MSMTYQRICAICGETFDRKPSMGHPYTGKLHAMFCFQCIEAVKRGDAAEVARRNNPVRLAELAKHEH